jgi:hypothetical protein
MRSKLPPVAVLTLACVLVACGGPPPAAPPAPAPSAPETAAAPTTPTGPQTSFATAAPLTETIDWPNQLENFEAARFSDPLTVDNRWFPLKPGMQYVYEGSTEDAEGRMAHRFVLTVTDLTKEVMGVPSVVVWDQDFSDGTLVESEIALFAQADDGNIWHFGQYPEVYENGEIVETPTWIAGTDDARPGITIKATPELGGPSYSQGWSPNVPWTDRARVAQVGVQDCVPHGCYVDGIVTEEFSREEPGAVQLKYYATGIGNTRVSFSGTDETKETLELMSVTQLDAAALTAARDAVLALEKRAYAQSPDVYGTTPPAQQRP